MCPSLTLQAMHEARKKRSSGALWLAESSEGMILTDINTICTALTTTAFVGRRKQPKLTQRHCTLRLELSSLLLLRHAAAATKWVSVGEWVVNVWMNMSRGRFFHYYLMIRPGATRWCTQKRSSRKYLRHPSDHFRLSLLAMNQIRKLLTKLIGAPTDHNHLFPAVDRQQLPLLDI